jgi:hypothetical protein
MGADGSESRITLALALCQAGRADEALAVVDEVGFSNPYLFAVRALARAMTADPAGSIADADLVIADASSSYLDRVIADVAAGAAHLQLGAVDEGIVCLDRAGGTAGGAGDVIARELVALARGAVLGRPAQSPTDHLGPGWRQVVDSLAAVARDADLDVTSEPIG